VTDGTFPDTDLSVAGRAHLLSLASAQLADWLQILGTAMGIANDGVLLTDPLLPGKPIVFASDGMLALIGCRAEEIIGHSCSVLYERSADPAVTDEVSAAMDAGRRFHGTVVCHRFDGSAFMSHLRVHPLQMDAGGRQFVVGVFNDTSTQGSAFAAHQQLGAYSRLALEFLAEYSVRTGAINWVGGVDERMGYANNEFPRTWDAFLDLVHPDDAPRVRRLFDAVVAIDEERHCSCRIKRRDGHFRSWRLRGQPVAVEDGRAAQWLIICDDVTISQHTMERLLELRRHLLLAREHERRHVARELHDDIAQRLGLLSLNLGQLEAKATRSEPPQAGDIAAIAEQTNVLALDVGKIARNLHPTVLDHQRLADAMRDVVDRFAAVESSAVSFSAENLDEPFDPIVELTFYRVLQEALRNISKHAAARNVRVQLRQDGGLLRLSIEDDGIGFDVDSRVDSGRLGLLSMQERIELIGGYFSIDSSAGHGTTVMVVAGDNNQ
jgi:PAS domain S-box-containing protein